MIRFSAALVAVAIGVLIGGVATSELSLVYIAIVVSAVALVALAIGVVLKREELFGEGQGLMPAAAGVGPVLTGRAGESQDKVVTGMHVAPPPPSAGAAAGYAPVVGNTAVGNTAVGNTAVGNTAVGSAAVGGPAVGGTAFGSASSSTPAAPSTPRTAPAGQGRPADPASAGPMSADTPLSANTPMSANTVPPWESQAAPGPWPPLAADWMSSGQGDRAASAAGATAGRAPSAWQDAAPPVTQAGRSLPDTDAQAAATAPRPWAPQSSPPVPSDTPDVKPAAGSGSGTPSWFDRLGGQAKTAAPTSAAATSAPPTVSTPTVSTPTGAPPAVPGGKVAGDTESGDPVAGQTVSGNTGAGDDDDDWPTRYSWLDDEGGEADEEASDADTAAGAKTAAAETVAAPTLDEPTDDVADADQAEEPDAHIIAFPGPATAPTPATAEPLEGPGDEASADGVDDDAEADSGTGTNPPATSDADTVSDAALVTVVPGVPRYHRPDCVLIRFMPDGDVQKVPVAQAKDAGCTPCAACQPAG